MNLACTRAGCDGTLDEDGFCEVCGLEAPLAQEPAEAAVKGTLGTSDVPKVPFTAPEFEPSGRQQTPSARTASAQTHRIGSWSTSPAPSSGSTRSGSGPASSRGMLGAGLVEMPLVPYQDPSTVVLENPQVPEDRRFCSRCGSKVGRSTSGRKGRTEGFCPSCGQRFSFSPKLFPGQLVHGQYEVLGCLAHGGLGWVYLALDRAVSDRWVVLKGLLDTSDSDAMAAALAERHFLAKVEHPNIVKIHNFVQHRDQHGDTVGYIVMEYVGGQSLKDMIKQRRAELGPRECLPLDQAIAYTIETLRPLGYLHSIGLLFCDFKPDNVIQTQEQLKLIDLGAVRHSGDTASAVYGTIGYQAPEVETEAGPSPAADLYAVGRSLAVMSFPFEFQTKYRDRLPPRSEVALFEEFDSFHRLLRRATDRDRERRFTSAEEMAEQLTGVLREVLSAKDGQPRPGTSTEFTPERRSFGSRTEQSAQELDPKLVANALPVPRVNNNDPSAAFLASVGSADPVDLVDQLSAEPQLTDEIRLRLVRAHVEIGNTTEALGLLDGVMHANVSQRTLWRAEWHRGLALLAGGRPSEACTAFETVLDAVPGELAPKLAIAASAECAGEIKRADGYYRAGWRTDRAYVSAAFGLARCLIAQGEHAEAADVLNSVPETSSNYVSAQLMAVRAMTTAADPGTLSEADLARAGDQLTGLELDPIRETQMSAELLEVALAWTRNGHTPSSAPTSVLLGYRLTEPDLRRGLERCYRALARQAVDRDERVALVDRANQVRPRTWL